jgi:hypothetical protein
MSLTLAASKDSDVTTNNGGSSLPTRLPTTSLAVDLLKTSTTLKRVAPVVDRTSFSHFNDVGHSPPEKKRRKQVPASSKDFLSSSSGALSSFTGSSLSEVVAAAKAADGSHSLLHRAVLSRSASSTISSSSSTTITPGVNVIKLFLLRFVLSRQITF